MVSAAARWPGSLPVTINQDAYMDNLQSKITDGAMIGGALSTILIWVLGAYGGVDAPPEVAAAFAVLVTAIAQMLLRERRVTIDAKGAIRARKPAHQQRSPAAVGLLAMLLVTLMLTGCVGAGGQRSIGNSIGASYLTVQTLADAIRLECGNVAPGGECTPDSVITTAEKENFKHWIGNALASIDSAHQLYEAGNEAPAGAKLQIALGILQELETILLTRGLINEN